MLSALQLYEQWFQERFLAETAHFYQVRANNLIHISDVCIMCNW